MKIDDGRSASALLFAAAGLTACGAPSAGGAGSTTPPPDDAEAAVGAVLDDWHAAAAASDEARYFDHFAEGGVFLGTDATERWDAAAFRAYAHPHFEAGRGWSMRSIRRDVVVEGTVAWFDEDLETVNLGPARGSGVLVWDGARWRIAQYNLALTIPNERFPAVRAALTAPAEAAEAEGAEAEGAAPGDADP